MSLTTVAELRSTLGVGTLYPDATLQEVCDAADAVLLPMLWSNKYYANAHSNQGTVGTLYFPEDVLLTFYVGQTVNITGAGSHFNGNKTITSVGKNTIQITTDHLTDNTIHPFAPFATVAASTYTDWSQDPAIQEAALMISVDIWQARQVTSSGGNSVDLSPSTWRMNSALLAKVRGLIAHALDPNSMVG